MAAAWDRPIAKHGQGHGQWAAVQDASLCGWPGLCHGQHAALLLFRSFPPQQHAIYLRLHATWNTALPRALELRPLHLAVVDRLATDPQFAAALFAQRGAAQQYGARIQSLPLLASVVYDLVQHCNTGHANHTVAFLLQQRLQLL